MFHPALDMCAHAARCHKRKSPLRALVLRGIPLGTLSTRASSMSHTVDRLGGGGCDS